MQKLPMRPTQFITSFGPGSIVDFPNLSLMPASIKHWDFGNAIRINEPRLQKHLRVRGFYSLPRDLNKYNAHDLPAIFFPKYVVCPICSTIGHLEWLASNFRKGYYKGLKCRSCKKPLYPARFVIACEKGHIDDFPWSWWVHKGKTDCPGYDLEFYTLGRHSGLEDIIVKCRKCEERRNLSGIFNIENLKGFKCTGKKPWVDIKSEGPKTLWWENESDCKSQPKVLQRGASNIYFPIIHSALSIPVSKNIYDVVSSIEQLNSEKIGNHVENKEDIKLRTIIEFIKDDYDDLKNEEIDNILKAVKTVHLNSTKDLPPDDEIIKDIRKEEWNFLVKSKSYIDLEFDFDIKKGRLDQTASNYIDSIFLVKRIREVRVLLGFNRIDPYDSENRVMFIEEEKLRRLPATEVKGEGIFIILSKNRLKEWLNHYAKSERFRLLEKNFKHSLSSSWGSRKEITPTFILTHSLAHSLIRQMSMTSGYSASSLRERIYCIDDFNSGILIYTASSDSEGTLGGLVNLAKKGYFRDLINLVIENSQWCSSDPLCIESTGQGLNSLNLAACHACLLLPETSCEERNNLLDRATLIGSVDNKKIGYFNDF